MIAILEGIFKGLLEWLYSLILEIVEYISNGLLSVFSMDMEYFTQAVPVAGDIFNIILASAWALLLGNLVFQAAKSMMSGLGLEGENPAQLFARTFLFAFLLLASRQICEIGLGLSGAVIERLQIPDSVSVSLPGENLFGIDASWLLMIIVGMIVMWQIVKLFLAVGERYFLVGFLTIAAPWAFAMGGSKSTADIFKGWVRMFATMCLMMVLNVVFLKILLSAMGNMPNDGGIVAWVIFIIAICRVARKVDTMIMRVGLNPVPAGDALGRGILGSTASFLVMRTVTSGITKAAAGMTASKAASANGTPPPHGTNTTTHGRNTTNNKNSASHRSGANQTANSHSTANQSNNTVSQGHAASVQTGTAGTASNINTSQAVESMHVPNINNSASQNQSEKRQYYGTHGMAGKPDANTQQVRRTSVPAGMGNFSGTHGPAYRSGTAGTGSVSVNSGKDVFSSVTSGSQRPIGTAGTRPGADGGKNQPSRYSAVPRKAGAPAGTHGTAGTARSLQMRQGGMNVSSSSRTDMNSAVSNITNERLQHANGTGHAAPTGQSPRGTHGHNGTGEIRKSSASADSATNGGIRHGGNAAQSQVGTRPSTRNDGGTASARQAPNSQETSRHGRNAASESAQTQGNSHLQTRHGRNGAPVSGATHGSSDAARHGRNSSSDRHKTPEKTNQHQNGTAGNRPAQESKPPVQKAQNVMRPNNLNHGTRRVGGSERSSPDGNRRTNRNKDTENGGKDIESGA